METDLGDVGLNALEALEAQDNEQNNSQPEGEGEKDTSETEVKEPTEDAGGSNEEETDNDSEDAGEDEGGEDNSGEEETPADKEEEPEKKELSDDEFEELAKKKGYAKAKSEDEQKAEDERQATMDKLLSRPKEIEEEVWDNMTEENKVIYNALPYITAEGKRGVIKVKTPEQLPDNFQFRSEKAMMRFQNDLQAQELKATQMANAIASRAERVQRETAQREEAGRVVSEIESLQKSGDLPTPKAKYGTADFDKDPAVLTINKVLEYRVRRASEGTNLSVRDSLLLYKAEHPEEFVKKEAKGDIERKNIAKKVAGNSKATSSAVNADDDNKAHYYKTGMSTEDVLDRILDDMD